MTIDNKFYIGQKVQIKNTNMEGHVWKISIKDKLLLTYHVSSFNQDGVEYNNELFDYQLKDASDK